MSIPTVLEWNQRIVACSNCYGTNEPLYPEDPPVFPAERHSCSMPFAFVGNFEAEEKASGTWDTCGEADTALASASWNSQPASIANAQFFSDAFFCYKQLLRYRIVIPDAFTGSYVHLAWDEVYSPDGTTPGSITPKAWTWNKPDDRTSDWSADLLPPGNGYLYLRNAYSWITHGTIYGVKPARNTNLNLWP